MGLEQSVSDSPFALWLVYPCAKWSSLPSLPCWLQHISFFFMNMFLCQFYSLSRSCFSLDWLCCKSMLASRAPLAWPATVTWRVCSHLLPLETLYTPWWWLSWFLFLIASIRLPAPKTRLLFFFFCCTAMYSKISAALTFWWFCYLSTLSFLWCEANFTLTEDKVTHSVACVEGCSLFITGNICPHPCNAVIFLQRRDPW